MHQGEADTSVAPWILLLAHLVDGHLTGQPPVIWAPPSKPGQLINDAEWLSKPFSVPLDEAHSVPQTCEHCRSVLLPVPVYQLREPVALRITTLKD